MREEGRLIGCVCVGVGLVCESESEKVQEQVAMYQRL